MYSVLLCFVCCEIADLSKLKCMYAELVKIKGLASWSCNGAGLHFGSGLAGAQGVDTQFLQCKR